MRTERFFPLVGLVRNASSVRLHTIVCADCGELINHRLECPKCGKLKWAYIPDKPNCFTPVHEQNHGTNENMA